MKKPRSAFVTALILLLLTVVLDACRRNEQRYDLKGKVVMVEKEKNLVTIAHEDVAGLMPAMTMPFTVPNQADIDYLAPEDQVTATLVVDGSHSWLENLFVVRTSGSASGVVLPAEAKEGDEVPNYVLKNQDGKEIRMHDYRGKALLLTFIYTRCPLPEYCTLMSNNFAHVDRRLQQTPDIYNKTHLLSVSIDPAYDTPEVLRSYGAAHTERYQQETFAHWEFASGEQVKQMAQFFGLRYFPEKDEIIHGLKTVIIRPDGKVAKVYSDNEWKPEDAVNELKRLIGPG
ncbi:MAG TPA: SCO family protein [Pyrinomonadaceae bacterium]|nr:SCO family protein [Pyrinomonadaceae bacterium]